METVRSFNLNKVGQFLVVTNGGSYEIHTFGSDNKVAVVYGGPYQYDGEHLQLDETTIRLHERMHITQGRRMEITTRVEAIYNTSNLTQEQINELKESPGTVGSGRR